MGNLIKMSASDLHNFIDQRAERIVENMIRGTRRILRESNNDDWYAEEDYDGKVGQPGMVRSYDVGYITEENAEIEAKEQGYNSLEDYLKDYFNEISYDCPWTWQKLGGGYGYKGSTIFRDGNVVCKEIWGQIMFDEYAPDEAEYEENFQKRLNKGEWWSK